MTDLSDSSDILASEGGVTGVTEVTGGLDSTTGVFAQEGLISK